MWHSSWSAFGRSTGNDVSDGIFYSPGAKISAFSVLDDGSSSTSWLQKMKWQYLGSWAINQKNKDTLFSSTFKVWESKVPLIFWFMAQGPKYWHFINLQVIPFEVTYWKMGYLAAALPVVFQQKNFTWWFLYPKGMGLALLLIDSKNFGILDLPNASSAFHIVIYF